MPRHGEGVMQKFRVSATVGDRMFYVRGGMSRGDVLRFLVADMGHAEGTGDMSEEEWIEATGQISRVGREGGTINAGRMQYVVTREGE